MIYENQPLLNATFAARAAYISQFAYSGGGGAGRQFTGDGSKAHGGRSRKARGSNLGVPPYNLRYLTVLSVVMFRVVHNSHKEYVLDLLFT